MQRVDREWIPPVTPSKDESQVANSENEVQETNSVQRKQKRKKYKPKVVDDGSSSKKSKKSPGNSKSLTPDLKDTNAKAPMTPDLKPQCPRVPITPELKPANHEAPIECGMKPTTPEAPVSCEPKLTNHEAPIACESKPTTPEGPLSLDPIPQSKRVQIASDPKSLNPEACITPDQTCMDSKAAVPPDTNPENIRFYNAADSKTEKLEAPVTPDPKSDLKPLKLPGLTQSFVRKRRGLHNNKDKNTTDTEPSLEKSSMGMQSNNEAMARPTKSVRRQLNFGVEDYTELVSSEKTIAATNPNLNESVIAMNVTSDDVIEQPQPLQDRPDSGAEAENEPVMHEENTSVTTQSPESSIGITTGLNCRSAVKPVQLATDGLNFDLGDKTEAVMHGEMHAGKDSRLNQGETGKGKSLMKNIDRIVLKDYLIHLTAQRLRGVKRGRPKRSPKSNFNDMLEEVVLKMTHMKLYENALIPYQYKKGKHRGIVALDEDSLIEWNILMGEYNGSSNSAPGLNPEREEKWRKERDTFRNMAEWFIAKMKLIQGSFLYLEPIVFSFLCI